MSQHLIHTQIVRKLGPLETWFHEKHRGLRYPFYCSFDIRDSGHKFVPVDANAFPAGFNNICRVDRDNCAELARTYLATHYPDARRLVLLTEEHTNNPYYWENVAALKEIIEKAGREVFLSFPRPLSRPIEVHGLQGSKWVVVPTERAGGGLLVDGRPVDLIISNNDFSDAYLDWMQGLATPINPPHDLGWHRRRKNQFFDVYNRLALEFCQTLDIDPFLMQIETRLFSDFNLNSDESRQALAEKVDALISDLSRVYKSRGLETQPFVFIKNSSGTYGLGVTQVRSGREVLSWNNKSRKKMKAAKGGREVEEVIIQEGVPTIVSSSGRTAEPAIYMIGCNLAGGFLRTHSERTAEESLNSPGATYQRLCVSDLKVDVEGHPMANVYGWIAKLGFLAIAIEAQKADVEFKGYRAGESCDKKALNLG
jgi:glutamate--cysteine ligase